MFVSGQLYRSLNKCAIRHFSQITFNRAASTYQDTKNVQLRGVVLKGRYSDLPNMIFLPEIFDTPENWIPFFTNPQNKVLNYRNVHIITPRNFGNSDKNESFDIEELSADVLRYMWENKLSTATLAGHGIGGRIALATGCYYPERSTGAFIIDASPMDIRYHESFQEVRTYVDRLSQVDMRRGRTEVDNQIRNLVQCPKWRSLFHNNLTRDSQGKLDWKFNMKDIKHNLSFNKADSLGYWPIKAGLYAGRAWFAFPEYSRWVHLNTNTLPMMKICPRVKGFAQDIHSIPGDENALNHWMYEFETEAFALAAKMVKFVSLYDGVHVLLQDRTEVGKAFIPDRIYSRDQDGHIYSDYSPAHLHHNWRFNDKY